MSKTTTLLAFVLSFIFLVSAQSPPSCASTCFISSPPAGCSQTDFGCVCKDQAYVAKLACCAVAACPASDLPAVSQFAVSLCQNAGVTIDATPPTNCSSTASASSASASASASATAKSSAPSNFANNLASFFAVTGALVAGCLLL